MQDAKEEVRARLNIEDVVGEYVQLKRAGRSFKGLSPFSGEKTPSFYVSPDKHIWHDFSSGKGGDVFAFVMEVEGMDFRQALEHLARKAGVDLSVYKSRGGQEIAQKKKQLLAAHTLAATYYQQSLLRNQHALEYVFKKRGLSKDIVQEFAIGYAPDSGDALVQFLVKKGFSKNELADGGLTNRFGSDLFRGRMTVPLMDGTGNVIGFTARIIGDVPNAPKYLNTPATLLYDKSRHVFGLSQAKEAIRANDYAVIVEGNLDVVSSHQAGIKQVVATAGTALTEHHLRALVRLSGNVRLAFDNDKAGLAATERAIPIAQHVGVELSIVTLKGGAKDADELIQQDATLWQQSIDDAQPVVDWILQQYEERENMKIPAGKRKYTSAAFAVIDALQNQVERTHYLQIVAQKTDTPYEVIVEMFENRATDEPKELKPVAVHEQTESKMQVFQDAVLVAAFMDPAVRDLLAEVEEEIFIGEDRQAALRFIAKNHQDIIKDTPDELKKYDDYITMLIAGADMRYAEESAKERYFETAKLIRQVITEHKKQQKEILDQQLKDAEDKGEEATAAELRARLVALIKEIHSGR